MKIHEMLQKVGGTPQSIVGPLPDGSGFMIGSFPLPKDHWLYADRDDFEPLPAWAKAVAEDVLTRAYVRNVARHCIRRATQNGKIKDFDPDALVQILERTLCGSNEVSLPEPFNS